MIKFSINIDNKLPAILKWNLTQFSPSSAYMAQGIFSVRVSVLLGSSILQPQSMVVSAPGSL